MSRAPVHEALVDLRARAVHPVSAEAAAQLRGALAPDYPNTETINLYQARLVLQKGAKRPEVQGSDAEPLGYRLASRDGLNIAQFRNDGFTHNRLAPYRTGRELIDEALRLWNHYVRLAEPVEVKRIALRYINRIDGVRPETIGDVLARPVSSPEGAPFDIDSFESRVVNVQRESGVRVITTTRLDPPVVPGPAILLLDIDAFVVGDFGTDPQELKPVLHRLQELKNDVFFGSITEAAAGRYE